MKVTYDPVANAFHITLREGQTDCCLELTECGNVVSMGESVLIHVDKNNNVLGIEILGGMPATEPLDLRVYTYPPSQVKMKSLSVSPGEQL